MVFTVTHTHSAERGIATLLLSVRNVEVLWQYRLGTSKAIKIALSHRTMEPKIGNLVAGEHPNFGWNLGGAAVFSRKYAKSLKPGEAGQWLLLITNRKLHMRFQFG